MYVLGANEYKKGGYKRINIKCITIGSTIREDATRDLDARLGKGNISI